MDRESLDFTKKPIKDWRAGRTPEEIARIEEKVDALNARGRALLAEQEGLSDPKSLDFTRLAAKEEDTAAAEKILEKIRGIPTDRVIPDDNDPYSKHGDQANRRNIH